jgi:hypothetical protein
MKVPIVKITFLALLICLMFTTNLTAQNLSWAKSVGGASDDWSNSLVVDASGNVYITGYYSGTVDFDPGAGTSSLTSAGGYDTFFAKYGSDGTLVWAKSIGGTLDEGARAISLDGTGNIYICGSFEGTSDFDPGAGTTSLVSNGARDVYFAKYASDGSIVWAKNVGSTTDDMGHFIVVETSGIVYICGFYQSTMDFDPGAGTTNLTSAGNYDAFFAKYASDGSLIWAKSIGGTLGDYTNSIVIDASSNVYITGVYSGTSDFDPGAGTTNMISNGGYDSFFAKYASDGSLIWAKSIGGASNDLTYFITLDASVNIYVTGYYSGTSDFDPGAGTTNLTSAGTEDGFFAKYATDGSLIWAKSIGSTSIDEGISIVCDASSNVYMTGLFSGTVDFDPSAGTTNMTSNGGYDSFFAKYASDGSFVWAKSVGGVGNDKSNSIVVNTSGEIYITGQYANTADFDPSAGTTNLTSAGSTDVFFAKYNQLPTLTTTAISSITGTTSSSGGNVSSDGGASVTARGVVWSTSTSPTVALATKTSDGTGTGAFTSSITGLSLNTTYYVRAYATNTSGTSYGTETSFTTLNIPTLTTTAMSSVTGTTATSGGNISTDGGASVTARGIVWNTSTTPTIALATKTSDGTGTGAFTSSMTGLSFVTTYYVRAYATSSVGTAYGNEVSFTTNASAVAEIYETENTDSTKITYNAKIVSDGGQTVTERGIVLDVSANPTLSAKYKVVDTGTGLGEYSASFTTLAKGKKYYARSYAINIDGISYSEEQNVYTLDEDGVKYELEKDAPNRGDGNGDGIPDYAQNNVVSLESVKRGNYMTIATSDDVQPLINAKNSKSSDASTEYVYPYGMNSFKINASSATVSMYFHGTESMSNYVYRKKTAQGRWINYDRVTFSTVTIAGKQIAKATLVLTDGDPASDADGVMNGVIDDPGGPAFLASPANIPVWNLKHLILLLCMFGVWVFKSKIV